MLWWYFVDDIKVHNQLTFKKDCVALSGEFCVNQLKGLERNSADGRQPQLCLSVSLWTVSPSWSRTGLPMPWSSSVFFPAVSPYGWKTDPPCPRTLECLVSSHWPPPKDWRLSSSCPRALVWPSQLPNSVYSRQASCPTALECPQLPHRMDWDLTSPCPKALAEPSQLPHPMNWGLASLVSPAV